MVFPAPPPLQKKTKQKQIGIHPTVNSYVENSGLNLGLTEHIVTSKSKLKHFMHISGYYCL